MSAEATGWVWKFSPYRGSELLVHLAIADVVNDANGNEFWMSGSNLATKAKVSRSTVTATLRDLLDRGFMVLIESGAEHRRPSRFQFLMPGPSAISGLASANTGHATSAISGLVDDELDRRPVVTSAISSNSHDRTARANPKEITQEPKQKFSTGDPDCPSCQGRGEYYQATAGQTVTCRCARALEVAR